MVMGDVFWRAELWFSGGKIYTGRLDGGIPISRFWEAKNTRSFLADSPSSDC